MILPNNKVSYTALLPSLRRNSRRQLIQQRRIDRIVTAITGEVNPSNIILLQSLHQTLHLCGPNTHRIDNDSRLVVKAQLEFIDGRLTLVRSIRVFKLDNRAAIPKVTLVDDGTGIEHDGGIIIRASSRRRLDLRPRVGRHVLHVCLLSLIDTIRHLVEEDSRQRDIGRRVLRPARIDCDIRRDVFIRSRRVVRGHVPDKSRVVEFVQARNAGDVVCVWVLRGAGPAVRVDYDLEFDVRVGGHGFEDGGPEVVFGIDV